MRRRTPQPADIRDAAGAAAVEPGALDGTVRALVDGGVAQIIECGPGKVLTGLNRRIERRAGLEFLALEDPASIDAALAATRRED